MHELFGHLSDFVEVTIGTQHPRSISMDGAVFSTSYSWLILSTLHAVVLALECIEGDSLQY